MLAVRATRTGYTVGEPYVRKRRGKPGFELRNARYVRTADELAKVLERLLAQAKEASPCK